MVLKRKDLQPNTYPCKPFEGGAPTKEGWGMLVRLAGTLLHSRTNIPLRRFAFAAHRCPPSKRDVGLAKIIGADRAFKPHRHPPAPPSPFEGRIPDLAALPDVEEG